mgnify:CR=1 FL=1
MQVAAHERFKKLICYLIVARLGRGGVISMYAVVEIGGKQYKVQEGDVVFVDIDPNLAEVSAGKVFGTIEAVKTVSDLYAPVSGKVVAINDQLSADAAIVNRDPYGEGWLIKVEMSNTAEVEQLLTAEQYQELIGQ